MRRTLSVSVPLLACLLACQPSTAPSTETPESTGAPAATTPADGAPTEVADATVSEEDAKKDEEAKKQAELEKKLAERLAAAEKAAEEKKARWTAEMTAKVDALTAKSYKKLDAGLKPILASDHRTPGNADRDKYRHPKETLKFFGLTPRMKVFEVGQGGGWYTEILAPLLAKDGTLYLAGYDGDSPDPSIAYNARAAELFVEGGGPVYSKIELVQQPSEADAAMAFGPDDSLDMIMVFRMLHNIHRSNRWDKVMPAAYAALKPGGVLAIVQHRAAEGANPDESAAQGYLPEKWLIEKVESYGFELDKKSEINANAKDTKDYDKGVWTLPPVLANGDTDKAKYEAIGESDRSTLKFIKPKTTK